MAHKYIKKLYSPDELEAAWNELCKHLEREQAKTLLLKLHKDGWRLVKTT